MSECDRQKHLNRKRSKMKTMILFPSDYFRIAHVDDEYQAEYESASQLSDFLPVLFNYDEFLQHAQIKLSPSVEGDYRCIYRGWMLHPNQYEQLYNKLLTRGIVMINSPTEYNNLHLFPSVYHEIKDFTPKAAWIEQGCKINWKKVNLEFKRFMIKDYVKSVKGTDFPVFFETPVDYDEMNEKIDAFIQLRDNLYTGGIVIKEYVNLKRYGSDTNEYRVFYLFGKIITVSRNANQPEHCAYLPIELAEGFAYLNSNYYTIDFAELDNSEWVILETGDGQVSGLSPHQYVFKYYDEIQMRLNQLESIE